MAYLLQHLLAESAARFADKEAARFKTESLTYRALDERTNQVAHALRQAGVKRGDRVAIYLHKSLLSVVSVFGILKAGAVYVPLDPNAPARRLAFITRNCGIRVLLTSKDKLQAVDELLTEETPLATVFLMDGDESSISKAETVSRSQIANHATSAVPCQAVIDRDLAYILYTSGSTGEPKGVMISHRTIFTFIDWAVEKLAITAEDRVTSHAPLHFDLSTFDIYATIKAGGTIVLVPENLSVFPIQLSGLLEKEGVTITYLVPSVLSMMVTHGSLEKHDLSRLRAVLFAGEVFPVKYLRALVESIPDAEYYNLYGPTETNVCTYHKVRAEDLAAERSEPVPIGVACENIEVFAINDDGELVTKPGEEGELWVRGSCVAQGYWGNPERTAQSFVPNVYQSSFAETAYRTGDIVCLDNDRVTWIYKGRRDHMIKSRGYRIELGDIEAALYSHPAVHEVAVIALPDELIGNRIKAFVVLNDDGELSEQMLGKHCAERLPRYMIPEHIEFIGKLPKTSSGKIDRVSLSNTERVTA